MAKDKSKKKDTSEEFAKPSEATSGGEGFKITDAKNRLVLIKPLREEEKKAFGKAGENGEKSPVIIADIVVLTDKKGKPLKEAEEHEDVWIFQRFIQGSIREHIGERLVLGTVRNTEDTTKARSSSGGYYWELEDAGDDEYEIAKAYRASLDPFSQKKGGKSKDKAADEKPSKKGKKSKAAPEPEPKKKDKGKKKK